LKAAAAGKIVVLGIQPRWPETGYGYIEFAKGVKPSAAPVEVLSFREKPDEKTARRFVDSGNFYWNAGMFFWRASVVLEGLRKFLPKTATLLASLPPFGHRRFAASLAAAFPKCENVSIDYALLERASNVAGIPAAGIAWNDVGSWNAVHELHKRDAHGNAVRAEAIIEASTGNYVEADKKLIALLGVKDLIVVDTPDALLIADRSRAQQVGEIVKRLEKAGRTDLL
jgi:mannose-1-phosphate guanylyltransferase